MEEEEKQGGGGDSESNKDDNPTVSLAKVVKHNGNYDKGGYDNDAYNEGEGRCPASTIDGNNNATAVGATAVTPPCPAAAAPHTPANTPAAAARPSVVHPADLPNPLPPSPDWLRRRAAGEHVSSS